MDDDAWFTLRHRLVARGLMPGPSDSLSLRLPGEGQMLWGTAADARPHRTALATDPSPKTEVPATAAIHQAIYHRREDVCAALVGGGAYGRQLPLFGGWMPAVFDEQIRQLGRMGAASEDTDGLRRAVSGGGNAVVHGGQILLLGMTPARLALNAELFEKCAKAYVCALASGGSVKPLPWWVRHIANGRLMKEQDRARQQVRAGQWPQETRGY